MTNQLHVIAPYWCDKTLTWVFDDASVGLRREPFVCGVPAMIDHLVSDIPTAAKGFRLTFSSEPFPRHDRVLTLEALEMGGGWYFDAATGMRGWLCPALLKYYRSPPHSIYLKAEGLTS